MFHHRRISSTGQSTCLVNRWRGFESCIRLRVCRHGRRVSAPRNPIRGTGRAASFYLARCGFDSRRRFEEMCTTSADVVPLPTPAPTTEVDGYGVAVDAKITAGADGDRTITFIKDGRPVTDLQPYLDTYAHVTESNSNGRHGRPGQWRPVRNAWRRPWWRRSRACARLSWSSSGLVQALSPVSSSDARVYTDGVSLSKSIPHSRRDSPECTRPRSGASRGPEPPGGARRTRR